MRDGLVFSRVANMSVVFKKYVRSTIRQTTKSLDHRTGFLKSLLVQGFSIANGVMPHQYRLLVVEGAIEPFTVIGRNLEIHYGTTFYKHGFEIPDGVLCEHVYLPCSIVIR